MTNPEIHPEYSVVIPVFNEEEILPSFIDDLATTMNSLDADHELLFVDDGSNDRTWSILQKYAKNNKNIILLRFARNFGHQAAVYAGLFYAKGRSVGVIDSDGQDPPKILAEMFKLLKTDNDVVYGVRKNRKESALKRFCFFVFYRILAKISITHLPLDSGDFSVMDRRVVEYIKTLNIPSPFLRGLRGWYGGKQKAYEYDRLARKAGKSKYPFFKLVDLAINGFTSSSRLPLRFAVYLGALISIATILYTLSMVILRIFSPEWELVGWASIIAVTGFVGGLNLMLTGMVGEYISHIFEATRKQPVFIISEIINQK